MADWLAHKSGFGATDDLVIRGKSQNEWRLRDNVIRAALIWYKADRDSFEECTETDNLLIAAIEDMLPGKKVEDQPRQSRGLLRELQKLADAWGELLLNMDTFALDDAAEAAGINKCLDELNEVLRGEYND